MDIKTGSEEVSALLDKRIRRDGTQYEGFLEYETVSDAGRVQIVIREDRPKLKGVALKDGSVALPAVFDSLHPAHGGDYVVAGVETESGMLYGLYDILHDCWAHGIDCDAIEIDESAGATFCIRGALKGLYSMHAGRALTEVEFNSIQRRTDLRYVYGLTGETWCFVDTATGSKIRLKPEMLPLTSNTRMLVLAKAEWGDEMRVNVFDDKGHLSIDPLRPLSVEAGTPGRLNLENEILNLFVSADVYGCLVYANKPIQL